MRFEFMKEHAEEFCIEKMAEILNVCRGGYYTFLKRVVSKRSRENQRLIEQIKQLHRKARGVYGSPRVHQELRKHGEKCSRKRVARLMKKEHIQAKMRKNWKVTAKRNSKAEISDNHLNQKFEVEAPDKVWASDITYVKTQEGWLYVAVVMDLFSRKIVGLSMKKRLETDLVTEAIKQALFQRDAKGDLMHHSDRGCQYTSKEFKEIAKRHGIKLSMSGKGNCYDNAVVESFFHTLKTEHANFCNYRIREEAKSSIFEYIAVFYNRRRMHSTLGYLSPEEFESHWKREKEKVA